MIAAGSPTGAGRWPVTARGHTGGVTSPRLLTAQGGPVMVWTPGAPLLAISSGPHGGGLGPRDWVLNATVHRAYSRLDPDAHIAELAVELGLRGAGTGLLTAVDVHDTETAADGGVRVWVSTALGGHPIWAAQPDHAARPDRSARPERAGPAAGTINAVGVLPHRLSEAALVNAVATVAEAKAQALVEAGVAGTGTVTDAVVLLCPADGPAHPFGGPRSPVGASLARAVHAAVRAGLAAEPHRRAHPW